MKVKRVLVAPLDWGLGHATRCITIVQALLKNNCQVYIAGSGFSLSLLKDEFPHLPFFNLPSYNPEYAKGESMTLKIASQLPKFIKTIREENKLVKALVEEHAIDYIIADNRYGCWSSQTTNIFITHQLNILLRQPLLRKIVHYFNLQQIKKFHQCWVPDVEGETNLSGELSINKNNLNVKYLGILSRFDFITTPRKYDLLILLSGPEPQRSILEEILIHQAKKLPLKILMVRGVDGYSTRFVNPNFEITDQLRTRNLQTALSQSDIIVSRSGYSTIMDLAKLGKSAIFIPTPGQTEQQYLAERLKKKGLAYFESQHDFNLTRAVHESKKYTGFKTTYQPTEALQKVIEQFL